MVFGRGDVCKDSKEKAVRGADLWGESILGRGKRECQGLREGHVWRVHGPVGSAVGLEGRERRGERKETRAKRGPSPAHGGSSGPQ